MSKPIMLLIVVVIKITLCSVIFSIFTLIHCIFVVKGKYVEILCH